VGFVFAISKNSENIKYQLIGERKKP